MAMKVKYTVLDGEIISENRGGTISDYVPDSLGSTRFLLGAGQAITDSWNYYPYGEAVHVTGTNPTPMQFVGTKGYYQDATANTYVRSRVLKPQQARWLTEDPIGLRGGDVNEYRYAEGSPAVLTDRTGTNCHQWIDDPVTTYRACTGNQLTNCQQDCSTLKGAKGTRYKVGFCCEQVRHTIARHNKSVEINKMVDCHCVQISGTTSIEVTANGCSIELRS